VAISPPGERLYGREALVNEVRSEAGVVIEGDCGVGGSAILVRRAHGGSILSCPLKDRQSAAGVLPAHLKGCGP
jgi:hypothetical protein